MLSLNEIQEMLEQDAVAQIKESLLNELKESILKDSTITPDIKTLLLFELTKHLLDIELEQTVIVGKQTIADKNTAIPSSINEREQNSSIEATNTCEHSPPQNHSMRKNSGLNKKLRLNLDGHKKEEYPKEQKSPKNTSETATIKSSEAHTMQHSPARRNSGSPRSTSLTKSSETQTTSHAPARRNSSSPRCTTLTKSSEPQTTSLSPARRNSGSPRWLLTGSSAGGYSPKRQKSHPSTHVKIKESPKSNDFLEQLPISKEIFQQYLSFAKTYLKEIDNNIHVMHDEDRPDLQLIVTPHRDMKNNRVLSEKTVILINRKEIEGCGANKVIKGYDLINRNLLAVKILNSAVTAKVRDIEIENLTKRGWFYGCYKLKEGEFAIAMKRIPGDTLLHFLYVIDDGVSQDDIYSSHCLSKKNLSVDLQYKIILNLMKEVLKLHEKFQLSHRDLKPANIKICLKSGEIKIRLIDFGDAVPLDSEIKELCGTEGYTDPEISSIDNQQPYKKDHDIFSLGIIIAEILTRKNYQQAIKEHKKQFTAEIVTPRMSDTQMKTQMDDVFKPEVIPDQYNNYQDHQYNMQNFMLQELKKLAIKMVVTRLRHSSLKEEIERLEALEKNSLKFSKKMESFFESKSNTQASLNKMNIKFNAGLFFPQKEFTISSPQDATECFKSMHSATDEENYKLFI
ncbi:protein kinase family protein [Legionella qingyii]|uniref:Protein kinase family protein n=1 Tax=Legionella qingyii TaxID=2184757 RepID=A0A317U7E0_9GAMM|nr:protein kinase family protein [Legionella qingyii]PWY56796.1 protein kinase family protein [Legionella qingyii]RUR23646.1 protein kinase family protein [Legionella qingyii]RUR26229.1 protein kinase family protein [Legionella qingyii]